jgi:hypothetical protein
MAAVLCWASGAEAAIAVAQLGNNGLGASATTVPITTIQDAAPGGVIIVVVSSTSSNAPSITDSATGGSNVYTAAASNCVFNTSNKLSIFSAPVLRDLPNSGTITVNLGGSTRASVSAIYVTGISGVVDQQPACQANTSSQGGSVSTGVLSNANELVVGATGINSTISGFSNNAPFNPSTGNATGNPQVQWGYDIVSSTASVTYAPTWTTARANGIEVWSFPAAAPSASAPQTLLLTGVGNE